MRETCSYWASKKGFQEQVRAALHVTDIQSMYMLASDYIGNIIKATPLSSIIVGQLSLMGGLELNIVL